MPSGIRRRPDLRIVPSESLARGPDCFADSFELLQRARQERDRRVGATIARTVAAAYRALRAWRANCARYSGPID
jgi:hypothetical protein